MGLKGDLAGEEGRETRFCEEAAEGKMEWAREVEGAVRASCCDPETSVASSSTAASSSSIAIISSSSSSTTSSIMSSSSISSARSSSTSSFVSTSTSRSTLDCPGLTAPRSEGFATRADGRRLSAGAGVALLSELVRLSGAREEVDAVLSLKLAVGAEVMTLLAES